MTSLLEGARKLVTRGSDLGGRIDALQSAAEAARGRLDDDAGRRGAGGRRARRRSAPALGRAHRGRDRRRDRLRQVVDVQPLTGLELSAVGVRRPTTSWATACVWGSQGAAGAAGVARHPAAPPDHARLDARQLGAADRAPRGPRDGRRGPARPARPRLHRGLAPPRGRPDREARRPAGVGARPAEVRRRGGPRPLSRAPGQPRERDGRRAQPHRHRARRAAPLDARGRPAAARPGRPAARSR